MEKETYGILVMDSSAATYATVRGRRLEIVEEITSGVPGKFRAGGQSARRFERLRESKLLSYFKRVGTHANEIFLPIEDLKGLIVAGPGPTKDDFGKRDYLHYELKDKIVSTIDTAYVGGQGVEEVMERAPEIMRRVRYIEEKRIVQGFLEHIGHDTGLATYGEGEVRRALGLGAVDTLLLSEELDLVRVKVACTACDYVREETMRRRLVGDFESELSGESCPKCAAPSLEVEETRDLVDDLAELADEVGADVEVISIETEEGQMLLKSFGGIAAILRFKH